MVYQDPWLPDPWKPDREIRGTTAVSGHASFWLPRTTFPEPINHCCAWLPASTMQGPAHG